MGFSHTYENHFVSGRKKKLPIPTPVYHGGLCSPYVMIWTSVPLCMYEVYTSKNYIPLKGTVYISFLYYVLVCRG